MKLIFKFSLLYVLLGVCASENRPNLEFCQKQSEKNENYIDFTVNPCEDFYEYVCGNWRVPYRLRMLHAHDTLSTMKAQNKYKLMEYFEDIEFSNITQLPYYKRAVSKFYNSCLNVRLKMNKSSPMKMYTDELSKYSLWPISDIHLTESKAKNAFKWERASAELRRFGLQTFFKVLVAPNWQASEQKIFYITSPAKIFDDEYSELLFEVNVKELLLDLGVRVRKAVDIADEIVQFEKNLMSLTLNEDFVILKEPHSLEMLKSEVLGIDWNNYFNILLQDFTLPAEYAKQQLVVADTTYLRKLTKFLSKSKVETVTKYLLVRFLMHFEVHLRDVDSYIKQKEGCLQQTQDFLPHELSVLFLELQHNNAEMFLQNAKIHLTEIFEKMKEKFEKMLNTTNIFDSDPLMKILGFEKLRAMRLLLPTFGNLTTLSRNLRIDDNYDVNLMNLSKIKENKSFEEVLNALISVDFSFSTKSSPLLASDVEFGPLNVNAYYRLKKNVIEIPVGILNMPLYDQCLKPANIYGSFVYILGHELLHGFDYDGLNYDKSGNVANTWNAKSIITFGAKSNCYLSDRYKNAHLLINENIADSEGLRLALDTFLATTEFKDDERIENLKLFFVSFGQTWCGINTVKENSLHSGNGERVNNVLSNFPEFIETYKCKLSNEMYSEQRCRIW